jgi:hypothetical protein
VPADGNYSQAENEEACAGIWSIYAKEAERYDKALVESWRADMEGMLIFVRFWTESHCVGADADFYSLVSSQPR